MSELSTRQIIAALRESVFHQGSKKAALTANSSADEFADLMLSEPGGSAARPRAFLDHHRTICRGATRAATGRAFLALAGSRMAGFRCYPAEGISRGIPSMGSLLVGRLYEGRGPRLL